jgi:hypothetical protein
MIKSILLGSLVTLSTVAGFATPALADGYRVTFNQHGTIVDYGNGQILSLGRSCDATFTWGGGTNYGTWNCDPSRPVAQVGPSTIQLRPIWGAPVSGRPSVQQNNTTIIQNNQFNTYNQYGNRYGF